MDSSSEEETATYGDTSSGVTSPSNSSNFSEGERGLAYHGPCIYEAKVQKAELRKKEWKYFVHYLGWNKNWDEWVDADWLMKHTEEYVMKQQALDKNRVLIKVQSLGVQVSPGNKMQKQIKRTRRTQRLQRQKGGRERVTQKDNSPLEKLVKIQVPLTLKKQLVDDWDFVTQQDKLIKLPRSPNVDDILTKYLEYRSKMDGIMTDSIGETLKGIHCYFDKPLPVMLLYKKKSVNNTMNLSMMISPRRLYTVPNIYYVFFVKLPELLAYVNIEEETLTRLQQKLMDFLKYRLPLI